MCETEGEEGRDSSGSRDIIPMERRSEVLHASTRSITLAGFTLAFLGLLFNVNPEVLPKVKTQATALLGMFVIFIGISELFRATAETERFEKIEQLYSVATLGLVLSCAWSFIAVFPWSGLNRILKLSTSTPVILFVLLKIFHIERSIRA